MQKLILMLLALLLPYVGCDAEVIKRQIDGVWYSFNTQTKKVSFVTGQGSGTNRTEFKGTKLHVSATMEFDGVTYTMDNIGNAFQGCPNLETLTFDSVVKFTEISLWAFAVCPKLKSVVVPEGVTTLGADRAFGSDKSLAEATLPTTIRIIGGWSFFEDPALKVVHIKTVTPPSLGTYAFGGSTNCVITVPDAAYNAYKNSSTWAAFNLMKESEYSVNSGKIALLNYLSANEAAMNAAKGGSTPDVCPMDKYALFRAAKTKADSVSAGEYKEAEYDSARMKLENAWEALKKSYNLVTTGYYNIQSAYPGFMAYQKVRKGMSGEKGNTLCWDTYEDLDPYQAFYVEALADGNYKISCYATKKNIAGGKTSDNGETVLMDSVDSREQVITPIGETQWIIADNVYDKAYHPQNHNSGNGASGNIVLFNANTVDGLSAWKFLPIHENVIEMFAQTMAAKETTKELVDEQKKAQALCDSVLRYSMSTQKLILTASQLSSNAKSNSEGTYAALIDGNTSGTPYFHSTYGNPADPGVPHYLQVRLTKGIKGFKAVLARRSGGYGYSDSPTDILISASKDGKAFTDITHYTTTWDANKVETKTTDLIVLGDEYRYIRFTVLKTSQNRCNQNQTHPYFTLSELQMYEANIDEENSSYFSSKDKQAAYTALQDLIAEQQNVVSMEAATKEDIAQLDEAMSNLRNPKPAPDPTTLVPAVGSKTKLVAGTWMAIGNCVGNADPDTHKDYTDYVREHLYFTNVIARPLGEGKINSAFLNVKAADYYTIEVGVTDDENDTPCGTLDDYIHRTSSGSMAYWLRKLIDRIVGVSPKAKIVLCTPRHSEDEKNLAAYAALIREIGEYEGYPVADLYRNSGGRSQIEALSRDSAIKPNAEGHQMIANEIESALEKVLLYDSRK